MPMHEKDSAEERIALAKALDLAAVARKNHIKVWSGFLNPAKADKFYQIFSKERDINVALFGGHECAERKMMGICVDYLEITNKEFPIDVLDITYDARFSRALTHRDFLGSILGLGIDRSRVGDIIVDNGIAHVFISHEMLGYVIGNLERVGRVKVTVGLGNAEDLPEPSKRELNLTVASLRLDAFISVVFNLSRGKSAELISGEKVFINWVMQKNVSAQTNEGDIITVRGLGRAKLAEVVGRTKKDRLGIRVERF